MDIETAIFEIAGKRLGVVQLEMVGSEALVQSRKTEIIAILKQLQSQNKLDLIFLTLLDIEAKLNRFVAVDPAMRSILEQALGVSFAEDVAIRQDILMRKEIIPLIKQHL